MQSCFTDLAPEAAAQRVADDRFAWPGGYALGIVTRDSGCLCSACVADNLDAIINHDDDPQWAPAAAYYCDPDDDLEDDDHSVITCDHCHRPISDATSLKPGDN